MPREYCSPLLLTTKLADATKIRQIVEDFTSKEKNGFPSLRFPAETETNLGVTLFSGILRSDRELLIYWLNNEIPVAFILTEKCREHTNVHIAGVWPDFRGQGVFSYLIERCLFSSNGRLEVVCHQEMTIAIRQLEKLGFRVKSMKDRQITYRS